MRANDDLSIVVDTLSHILPGEMPLPLFKPIIRGVTRVRSFKSVECSTLLVFVWAEILANIVEHGRSDLVNEIGGWLLGEYASDGINKFVVIEASLPAQGGRKGPAHFCFTCEAQQQFADARESHFPHLQVVGWYHSHPLGMRLSEMDKQVHQNFNEPFQVAMVLSTGGWDIGCAVWKNGQISEVGGFFVLDSAQG
ncbi:hypothetical protein TFLX_03998 [Thermoflexales bacterium]|nr:hypothetical protein TFLX_03998 [Thermoflexales bacterium]